MNISLDNLSKKIGLYAETVSGAKSKVSLYFLEHIEDIAFVTLDDISRAINVSASTITRTASEMGFKGYPDLQNRVRTCIKTKIENPADRFKSAPISDVFESYSASLEQDKLNIAQLIDLNQTEQFLCATNFIVKAHNVYLCGMQSSFGPIVTFGTYLSQIRPGVRRINLMNMDLSEQLLDISSKDVMLVVAFPLYNSFTMAVANEAVEHGCPIISLTDSSYSPIALRSAVSFVVPYGSVGFFNSLVAVGALLNALFAGINLSIKNKAMNRLEAHCDLTEKLGLSFHS